MKKYTHVRTYVHLYVCIYVQWDKKEAKEKAW